MSADSDTDTDMAMELFRLRSECQRYEVERIKLEEEVRFWRLFYQESIRLFGDKRGTLGELIEKAMKRIQGHCRYLAMTPDKLRNQRQIAYFEERSVNNWSKSHEPEILAAAYHWHLANPAGVSKEDAIRQVAKEFRFSSYGAAHKALERAGVKKLPPTWPKD